MRTSDAVAAHSTSHNSVNVNHGQNRILPTIDPVMSKGVMDANSIWNSANAAPGMVGANGMHES